MTRDSPNRYKRRRRPVAAKSRPSAPLPLDAHRDGTMKKGHTKSAASSTPAIGLGAFARLALVLTAGAALATLIVAPFQRGPEVVRVAAALFGAFAAIIWGVSMVVGLAIVVPSRAWRLVRRVARGPMKGFEGSGGVRDAWLDGPDPA